MMRKYGILFAGLLSVAILCSCGGREDFAVLMKKAGENAVSGKWEEALKYSKKAQSCQPGNAEAIVLTALAYEMTGKNNDALTEIQKAVNIAPKSYFVQYTYGRILYKFKKNDESMAALKTAVSLNPKKNEAKLLLARVAMEGKNQKLAYNQFYNLIKQDAYKGKAFLWNEIGCYQYNVKKNRTQALKCCFQAYSLDKKNPSVVLNFAILCDRTGRKSKAKSLYQYYLSLTRQDSSLKQKRAAVETRLKAI